VSLEALSVSISGDAILMDYRHSHRSSIPPSVATLSPAESQRGFGSLPRISEGEYKTYNNPSNSSSPMLEKSSPPSQSSKKSWLNRFLIKTHLSAPLRLGSESSGASTGANNPGGFLTNSEHTYHHAYTIDPEQ